MSRETSSKPSLRAERRSEDAEGLLRAEKLGGSDPVFLCLWALLAFRTHRYSEAVEFLDSIVDSGVREARVYLLRADIHERHFENLAAAAAELEAYLDLRSEPEAEGRLEGLQKTPG